MISGPVTSITPPIRRVGKIVLDVLKKNPDLVNQVDPVSGKCVTFKEMKDSSIRCATWLRKQNIGAKDVISFCGNDRIDGCIPLLASIYVGSIFNGWDYKIALIPAQHLLNQIKPKIMFIMERSVDVLMKAAKLENLDIKFILLDKCDKYSSLESLDEILNQQSIEDIENFEPRELDSLEEPGLITFSSGSTGLPKGVLFSYHSIFTRLFVKDSATNNCMMSFSTFFWISGVYFTLRSIVSESKKIASGDLGIIESLKVMEDYKVDWLFLSPSNLTQLSKSKELITGKYDLCSLKSILTGGSPLSQDILDDLRKHLPHTTFLISYGLTEMCGGCTVSKNNALSVGHLKANHKLKVVDPDALKIVGPDKVGEFYIKGPSPMLGYYKNPSVTQQAFDADGWFRTGDLGYYKEGGEIFITSRLKELIKYRNYQVSPAELENYLLNHPAVAEATVAPVENLEDGQRAMAFIVKLPGIEVSEDEIVEFSSRLGPSQTLWGGVKFLDEFPRTATGKIHKKLLWDMAKEYKQNS